MLKEFSLQIGANVLFDDDKVWILYIGQRLLLLISTWQHTESYSQIKP